MWSSRRAFLIGLAALSGCGFTPVYGPGGAAERLRGQVAVEVPATAQGYALRRRVLDRLGGAGTALELTVAPTLEEGASAIAPDGATTRLRLVGTADWRLTDAAGTLVSEGREEAFTAFSVTGSTVAARTARVDAEERLAVLLADRIVTRLIALVP